MTENKISTTHYISQSGTQAFEQLYSSSLPPPEVVKKYEEMIPGSGEQIFKIAQGQIVHRQQMEKEEQAIRKVIVIQEGRTILLGQVFSLIMVLGGICAGVFLIMNGKSVEGLVSMLTSLGIIIGAVAYQKHAQADK